MVNQDAAGRARGARRAAWILVAAWVCSPQAALAQAAPGRPSAAVATTTRAGASQNFPETFDAQDDGPGWPVGGGELHLADAFDPQDLVAQRRPFDVEVALGEDAEAPLVAAASRRLAGGDAMAATNALGGARTPAASLVQARIDLAIGGARAALGALARAASDGNLRPWVQLERGRAWLALNDASAAARVLDPLLHGPQTLAGRAVVPLAQALAEVDPARLVADFATFERLRDRHDPEARSLLLEARARGEDALGEAEVARHTRLERYLTEPLARSTPTALPQGTKPSAVQLLARLERLVDGHRNEAAAEALQVLDTAFAPVGLRADLSCRRSFARGIVARKRHRYAEAEAELGAVAARCADADLRRRAAYTRAKVASIQDGLRALPLIEAFAKSYPDHSMTDDVLFWAGDSLQRRGRNEEAARYYRRILALPRPDDQCGEAGWRLGWMAYRAGRYTEAKKVLQRTTADRCVLSPGQLARAHYWSGRAEEALRAPAAARTRYARVLAAAPLSFYAQQALPRLLALQRPDERRATLERLRPPPAGRAQMPCAGGLLTQPAFARALHLAGRGLHSDALVELRTVEQAPPAGRQISPLRRCGAGQADLLLVQLLERVGGHKEAHARLLRDFAGVLRSLPTAATLPVWQAAYPLAFRPAIAAAERESGLPPFLLQALSREESRFDAEVVSWAEAVGLTQLLLPSARQAGRTLRPPDPVTELADLFDPWRNARLGGALLGHYAGHLGGSWPLALAAYNGGQKTAQGWWRKHAGAELAVFAEEIGILETRTYVQRVLQTFGTYRWLYADAPPNLPVSAALPRG